MQGSLKSIALIGSFLPRQCGIATFTSDLATAIRRNDPDIDYFVVSMNDHLKGYDYPESVRFQINQDRLNDYGLAADFINMSGADIVSLQHEYGIFGGQRGGFILELLRNLKIPVVTTLHTVLRDPGELEHEIIRQLAALSERLVVMSMRATEFLSDIYGIPDSKIALIHHGIPDVPFMDPDPCRSKFVSDDKIIILTFGLLSPGKGIEYMVDALPGIVAAHPNVVYFVVGATHPQFKAENGEDYRLNLHHRATALGVADNIVFHDRFLDRDELIEIIRAADIYVTPYLNEAQVVSGTLAFALGAGKAVVSTPYWHAQEMLADGRGRLVPFRDGAALAETIIDLLDQPEQRLEMRRKAYEYCRPMTNTAMGARYLEVFGQARTERLRSPDQVPALGTLSGREQRLPQINLRHLQVMTDGTGILQHAKFTMPDRNHGYCVDDNARALIVTTQACDLTRADELLTNLSSVYLSFLDHAFNRDNGRFRNFMSFDRQWLEEAGSEDSHGRALWALGVLIATGRNKGLVAVAEDLFDNALGALEQFTSPRAIAYAILGLAARRHQQEAQDRVLDTLHHLGDRLLGYFSTTVTDEWCWHEELLTYDNGRLPQALIACGRALDNDDMTGMGLRVLDWLSSIQTDETSGRFTPIGNNGWYPRSGTRARYDQQPLEAAAMIDACIEAHACSRKETWVQLASTCFNWFLGNNDQQIKLYDHATGGCRDGLHENGVNENQGAESTLAWLMSLIAIYNLRGVTAAPVEKAETVPE